MMIILMIMISHVRLMGWYNISKQCRACKKLNVELLHIACHATREKDWCQKVKKKRNRTIFTDEKQ